MLDAEIFTDIRGDRYYSDKTNTYLNLSNGFRCEELSRTICLESLLSGDIFIDIGASIGVYTIPAAKIGSQVFAIECEKESCNVLNKNCALNNTSAAIINCFLDSNTGYSTLVEQGLVPGSKIKFLKIDIEGYEYQVLQTMEEAIKASPDLKCIIEYFPAKLLSYSHITGPEFIDYLHSLGLKTDYVDEHLYYHRNIKSIVKNVTADKLADIFKQDGLEVVNLFCHKEG